MAFIFFICKKINDILIMKKLHGEIRWFYKNFEFGFDSMELKLIWMQLFYYIVVYKNGCFPNIFPTTSFITLVEVGFLSLFFHPLKKITEILPCCIKIPNFRFQDPNSDFWEKFEGKCVNSYLY